MATDLGEALAAAAPELVVLTFDRIVPPSVLDAYPGRILNVHPALLPAFPGMRALERTVESGARVGGATIHEVVEAVDAGPIVAQAVLATDPSESVEAFGARMYALLEPMFLQVLHWYAQGRVGHDDSGRVIVRGATYGTLPISPALE
jgi:phosphoribosylglycinamide formyltransferase-1